MAEKVEKLPEPAEPKAPEVDLTATWQAWRKEPSPQTNAGLLKAMQPTIDRAVRASVGRDDALVRSKARALALRAAQSYEPGRGPLETHVFNHMRGLRRYAGQAVSGVKVPERVVLDRRAASMASHELADELGREPNDDELSARTGFSMPRLRRLRGYNPAMSEGFFASLGEGGEPFSPAVAGTGGPTTAWLAVIYDDLSPLDKRVFELSLGYNGHPQLQNQEIARSLRRSPGWVSQRRRLIQQLLDQERELSPFGGGT